MLENFCEQRRIVNKRNRIYIKYALENYMKTIMKDQTDKIGHCFNHEEKVG